LIDAPPLLQEDGGETVEAAALELVEEVGRQALAIGRRAPDLVSQKTDRFDVVTSADLEIEAYLRERIAVVFPDHAILGEEQGLNVGGSEWTWVLDPIDGTFNFASGLPGFASSIALMRGDETRVAAIADFGLDTVFLARKGMGMQSDRGPLEEPQWRVELSAGRLLLDPGYQAPDPAFFDAARAFMDIAPVVPRLIGSAAVSLAAIAVGGGCFAGTGLEIWDAAAGVLLAEERGRKARWWRDEGESACHVLVGDDDLVTAFEPAMPALIDCWRDRLNR
jgi:myo-inositol-1(or 4)-monophosphatase